MDDDVQAADLIQECEAKIAALERLVGRQALEIELLKGGVEARTPAEKCWHLRRHRARGISVSWGCELMGLSRSTFYNAPSPPVAASDLLVRIGTICDEFECYGYRRVGDALRHQGVVVNGKKLRRLMREHGLQPKQRRRYVVTEANTVMLLCHLAALLRRDQFLPAVAISDHKGCTGCPDHTPAVHMPNGLRVGDDQRSGVDNFASSRA